ncbi:ATP-binding protein [Bacillus sp. AK128]
MTLIQQQSSFQICRIDEYDRVVNDVEQEIVKYGCHYPMTFSTKIAFLEALDNAIEHGDFPINIKISNDGNKGLTIMIKDSGTGFLVKEKLSVIQEYGIEYLLQNQLYDERGRGIYMMYKTANHVLYNDAGNEVSLFIYK